MISILLPLFNGSKTLSETLDSIFNQNFKKFELLLVDDGLLLFSSICVFKLVLNNYTSFVTIYKMFFIIFMCYFLNSLIVVLSMNCSIIALSSSSSSSSEYCSDSSASVVPCS